MCGNDYLAYDLQVGPNDWTSWGTGPMMQADEFVGYVWEKANPDETAEAILRAGAMNIVLDVTGTTHLFKLRVFRAGLPLKWGVIG